MKTFNYSPTGLFTGRLTNLGIALCMIVVPLVYPFGLRIGRLRVLGPGAVTAIFVIGGVLLLLFTLLEIRKARILAAANGTITVDDDRVSYPVVKNGAAATEEFRISEIENIEYDDEENECSIRLGDRTVTLRSDFFDNPEEYAAFRALLGKE